MFNVISEVLIKAVVSTVLISPGLFFVTDNQFFDDNSGFILSLCALYIFLCFSATQAIFVWIKNR